MERATRASTQLKAALYGKPHPLFIWDEGGSESNVWTAASLYWALKKLDEEPPAPLPHDPARIGYADLPGMIWDATIRGPASAGLPDRPQLQALAGARTLVIENPVSPQWIRALPWLLKETKIEEVHFVSQAQPLDGAFAESPRPLWRIESSGQMRRME